MCTQLPLQDSHPPPAGVADAPPDPQLLQALTRLTQAQVQTQVALQQLAQHLPPPAAPGPPRPAASSPVHSRWTKVIGALLLALPVWVWLYGPWLWTQLHASLSQPFPYLVGGLAVGGAGLRLVLAGLGLMSPRGFPRR